MSEQLPNPGSAPSSSPREWKLIEKLVLNLGAEQRRARRWGIFFKLLTFAYLFLLLALLVPDQWPDMEAGVGKEHTALIEVNGVIADGESASADNIVTGLREAFKDEDTRGVILRINSPGGSPVQSGYVFDEIKRLRRKHADIKVYAVISDIGASGAYYIAAAADEVYADKASLVGSIGVVSAGFGFTESLEKLGVERRLLTAGESKGFLDPFSPLKETDVEFWQQVLDTTHRQFIDQVKAGRGKRLKKSPQLFTGLVWSGEQAVDLGLVDGLGSSSYVAREIIGVEKIVDFTPSVSPLDELIGELGLSIGRGLGQFLDTRALSLR